MNNINIKQTKTADIDDILKVEKRAFGEDSVAKLTAELLKDDSAEPRISLLVFDDKKVIGHILFTKCRIERMDNCPLMHILAPLAVIPEYQNKGIGGQHIREGLKLLREINSDIVFVLGHIDYYPKLGFIPDAGKLGYIAPYPIPDKVKDAWMVVPLNSKKLANFGKVICANAMDKPGHWRE